MKQGEIAGWTSCFFAKRGHSVVGQDIAPDMIELAQRNKQRHGVEKLEFIMSDYESLRFDSEFDGAVFYDSLHHADDEGAAIASAWRALKPDGMLITHEPGAGHSKQPQSIEAMRLYGVNEKDMPPERIFELGRQAGFRKFEQFRSDRAIAFVSERERGDGFTARFRPILEAMRTSGAPDAAKFASRRHLRVA